MDTTDTQLITVLIAPFDGVEEEVKCKTFGESLSMIVFYDEDDRIFYMRNTSDILSLDVIYPEGYEDKFVFEADFDREVH